jgi:hypothetical protein
VLHHVGWLDAVGIRIRRACMACANNAGQILLNPYQSQARHVSHWVLAWWSSRNGAPLPSSRSINVRSYPDRQTRPSLALLSGTGQRVAPPRGVGASRWPSPCWASFPHARD